MTAATAAQPTSPLLEIEHLHTYIPTVGGVVKAVDDVSVSLPRGQALGVVGESGSGKSVLARSIMGLLPPKVVRSGSVRFDGADLLTRPTKELEGLWGRRIAMIFQDPSRSLNPVVKVERQLTEGMRKHLGVSRSEARTRAVRLLNEVGVPDPERRLGNYPGQMSGGMRQRVMIAVALSCEPDLLIADEPTTALDVTIQRQILDLLERLRRTHGMSLLLISHDLGVVAGRTDRVAVMYAGQVVESGATQAVFARPQHRYTERLLQATPSVTLPRHSRLEVISGGLPSPIDPPQGCRFAPRCAHTSQACTEPGQRWYELVGDDHLHACEHPAPAVSGRVPNRGVSVVGR